MARVIYATNTSLDGYIEDERGAFDFGPIDAEVFRSHTDLLRSAGTLLYGRRLYEAMAVWETDAALAAQSDLMADFATAWQAAQKVVYSTTLAAPATANTVIQRRFDAAAVHELKATASSEVTIGGANLASQALAAGLIDECQLYVWPTIVGAGKPALPTQTRADLDLIDEHRYGNGVVLLRYRPLGP
ncbi:dihydrofolate reductase family protein [Microbacterium elymi]|uniref:Dihydrofolate reductase family protein n=1 Tax=Microbacterium elymi TaxID=2909587 RepID=A0ABY5NIM1_9MICO|nr:dihydrofolate reductase family protein [Microbacterium elymi]UUT34998.1 dihydrofolate reductase family protein [Microbacterium elymi]